jgi:aminoglycoside phosphotransferase (APT) family kinase protein
VLALPGDPPKVLKAGPVEPVAREARALEVAGAAGIAPALVCAGPGVVVAERAPGASRPLAALERPDARRLGALIRRLHALREGGSGGLPWWDSPARSLRGYRAGRLRDARARAGEGEAALLEALASGPAPRPGGRRPFRMLHGDLVASNVVWGDDGPRLVDWEFWRMGDPAEDLAYLCEVNGLPDRVAGWVLEGYGDPGEMGPRRDAWRGLVALDAGLWHRAAGDDAAAAPLVARARALAGR